MSLYARWTLAAVVLFASAGDVQSPPARPRILGVSHVAFRVSDSVCGRALLRRDAGACARCDRARRHLGIPRRCGAANRARALGAGGRR